ncbi:hypothetical protein SLEP1_g22110 [Rubroshorea leprosula]|uniref:Uncharacterized protein n=1 Tax=Rubroshorea leprosula TaxID=152421 RepID=A0AAV5JB89_9ROSI|nr:hypothetical protein SLEP1_g22110 [Rubroshorea leprosula]
MQGLFKAYIRMVVGDGRETSLFFDWWFGESRICDRAGWIDKENSWGRTVNVAGWWVDGHWRIPRSFKRI